MDGWTDGSLSPSAPFSHSLWRSFLFKILQSLCNTSFTHFQSIHLPNNMKCINLSCDPYFSSNHTRSKKRVKRWKEIQENHCLYFSVTWLEYGCLVKFIHHEQFRLELLFIPSHPSSSSLNTFLANQNISISVYPAMHCLLRMEIKSSILLYSDGGLMNCVGG